MATIGDINVKLTANGAAFASEMSRAQKSVSSFASVASAVGTGMLAAEAVVGVVKQVVGAVYEAGKAVAELTQHQAEAIDKTAKLADRIGVTTEFLAGLQHNAALSGVSAETLSGGLEKMLKVLGEASGGSKEASEAIGALGLSATALIQAGPAGAFAMIADKIANISEPAERAAKTMAIFGKSGQDIIPVLAQGAKGIEAAAAEAEALGLVFSRVDAAKVEEANDSLTKIKEVIAGIGNRIAISVAPYVTAVADKLVEWAKQGDTIQATIDTIGAGLKIIVDAYLIEAQAIWISIKGTLGAVTAIAATFTSTIAQAGLAMLKLVGATGLLPANFEATAQAVLASVKMFSDQVGAAAKQMAIDSAVDAMRIGTSGWASQFNEWLKRAKEAAQARAELKDLTYGDYSAMPEVPKVFADLEGIAKEMQSLQDALDGLNYSPIEQLVRKMQDMGASAQQLREAVALFNDVEGIKFANSVRDAIRTPLDRYAEIVGNLENAVKLGTLSSADANTYAKMQAKQLGLLDSKPTVNDQANTLVEANTAQAALFAYQGSLNESIGTKQLTEQQQMKTLLRSIDAKVGTSSLAMFGGL